MENIFQSKILDDLYAIRQGEVEKQYTEKYGKLENGKKAEETEKALVEFMKNYMKENEELETLTEKINKFELDVMGEMCFWYRIYYKVGFVDGISFKNEIKEEKINNGMSESIIYQNIDEILEYIEEQKVKNLIANKYYNKIMEEIKQIKTKFPRVGAFFYDEKISDFTGEEMRAILEIINLENDMRGLEADEMFKIGLREGKAL